MTGAPAGSYRMRPDEASWPAPPRRGRIRRCLPAWGETSLCKPMGLSELERLVDEAERDGVIRRSLRRCRSRAELVLAAQRLGYGIHRIDLRSAWLLHQRQVPIAPSAGLAGVA